MDRRMDERMDGWFSDYILRFKLYKSYIMQTDKVILIEHTSIREIIFKGFFKPILCYYFYNLQK